MGYDFEALEDGEVTMVLYRHDGSGKESKSFQVIKGKTYSWDVTGVEIRER
jgi:hypothetical protein